MTPMAKRSASPLNRRDKQSNKRHENPACISRRDFVLRKRYFLFPNRPRTMVLLPERITELRALRAAC